MTEGRFRELKTGDVIAAKKSGVQYRIFEMWTNEHGVRAHAYKAIGNKGPIRTIRAENADTWKVVTVASREAQP